MAAHFAKQRDHFGKLADKTLGEIVDLQEEIAAAPSMAVSTKLTDLDCP